MGGARGRWAELSLPPPPRRPRRCPPSRSPSRAPGGEGRGRGARGALGCARGAPALSSLGLERGPAAWAAMSAEGPLPPAAPRGRPGCLLVPVRVSAGPLRPSFSAPLPLPTVLRSLLRAPFPFPGPFPPSAPSSPGDPCRLSSPLLALASFPSPHPLPRRLPLLTWRPLLSCAASSLPALSSPRAPSVSPGRAPADGWILGPWAPTP